MFKKLFIVSLITAIFISLSITVKAAPLAEGYSYPTELCFFPSTAQTYIKNSGYDLHAYTYTSPYYVRRTMNKDAIFYISTHGMKYGPFPDGSYFYGGAVGTYNVYRSSKGTLSADAIPGDDTNYSLQAAWGNDSTALRAIKLSYWSACYSSQTSRKYGNLLEKCCQLGARCAFGFYPTIGYSQSQCFDMCFFYYASQAHSIYTSAYYAVQGTRENYYSAGGVDEWQAKFRTGITNSDVYILPADYGY